MSTISIIINHKPISINTAYYGHRKVLKKEARVYREAVWNALESLSEPIRVFREGFRPLDMGLKASVTIYTPYKKYYVEGKPSKGLSQLKGDLDNYLKLLNDFILNTRYQSPEHGASVVGIDDKYIIKYGNVEALPHTGTNWVIKYSLEYCELPTVIKL